jgi:PilZ domain
MRLNSAERRRSPRLRLQIPLFLRGFDEAGLEFLELTKTIDINATGALLLSHRFLQTDQLLRITIPVLSDQVSGLVPAETPPIQVRVLRSVPAGDTRLVGVEFLTPLD